MPFLIVATDKPNAKKLRPKILPQHQAFLDANVSRLLAAGAKLSDDGETALGSSYILDTDDRKAAEEFIRSDPFSKAGLFATTVITRWRKGYFDFQKVPPKS